MRWVVQKPLWAGWLLGWVRSSDKEICPSYLTHVGERGGANKENWFVSMKFHRGLPELRTKKWETTLGSQRARGWKSKNSLLDFLGLGGSRIFNRGTGSNLLPITLYEVRYLPIIPWNTMEYFKNHFCASVAFSSVVIWFFCAYSLYDFPTQAKDSLKRQPREIEDG